VAAGGDVAVLLICPLCGSTASDGPEPAPGECPSCGARYAGGGDDPRGGVRMALREWGVALDAADVADGLFRLMPDDPRSRRVAAVSDRRDGFYRWWVFVARDADAHVLLTELARA
jgi:hypothetical protein